MARRSDTRSWMKDRREAPNRIQELRLAHQWNQKELADRVSAHWVTISKLERGTMKLTQDWMARLAEALQVTPQEIISDPPLRRTVYVEGHIGHRGYVMAELAQEGYDTFEFHIDFGTTLPDTSIWYFAEVDISVAIRAGDLLRFTHFAGDDFDFEEHIGRICMLHFAEPHAPIAGVLGKGSASGLFDLTTPDGRTSKDFQPMFFTVLTMIVASPKIGAGDPVYQMQDRTI